MTRHNRDYIIVITLVILQMNKTYETFITSVYLTKKLIDEY